MKFLFKNLSLSSNRIFVLKNVTWSLIGRVVQILNSVIISVVVARYLKPEQFGMLNYAAAYITLFPLLTEFGISSILIRELSKKKTDKNALLGTSIFIRFVLSIITIVAIYISLIIFKEDRVMSGYILINSVNFVFLSVGLTIGNYFTAQLQNEQNVKAEVFRIAVMAVIKIICVVMKAPLFVFIILAGLDGAVILIYAVPLFIKFYGSFKKLKIQKIYIKTLMYSSFPLLLEGITGILYQKLDVVLTGKLISTEAVAYYAIALKFVDFAVFIPAVLVQTFEPMLIRKLEEADYDVNNENYLAFRNKIGDITTYSGILITVFLIIIAKPVITILYGTDYSASIPLLQILAIKGIFCGIAYPVSIIIVAEGRQKYAFLTNIVGAAAYLLLSITLIPLYGLTGVALSTIFAFIVGSYLSNLIVPLYRKDFRYQTGFLFKSHKRIFKYFK